MFFIKLPIKIKYISNDAIEKINDYVNKCLESNPTENKKLTYKTYNKDVTFKQLNKILKNRKSNHVIEFGKTFLFNG